MLEARGIIKRYGALTAVNDVSFAISPGQILGVLGPNGAGKSTIVKIVAGILEPAYGAVFFKGRRASDDLSSYKRALGYVPEQPELYGFLTGWEYLEMVAALRGLDRRVFRAKASAMLKALTLFGSRDLPISAYSKGMRQRIVVIAALMHNPDLLILDEPFSGLDATSALVLRHVVSQLAERGKAVLFSSPVLEQADKLCTHLVLLKRGAIAAEGSMDELREGFSGLDLEAGFMQLTEQADARTVAESITQVAVQS